MKKIIQPVERWIGLRVIIAALLLSSTVLAQAATPTVNEIQKLLAGDAASGHRFGLSVALDDDTAVVGVPRGQNDNGRTSGAAYVFTRIAGVWAQQQKLLATDGTWIDSFGQSVALDGDTAVVGAPLDDDNGSRSGSAYVFTRSGGVWTQQQKITASDAASNDNFGTSVSIDGDTALVGAKWESSQVGAAYVFSRDSLGDWTQQAKLQPNNISGKPQFGASVALDGDTAVVGAFAEGMTSQGFSNFIGNTYVFTRDSSGAWTPQQKLHASDAEPYDQFGLSVALDGDTAVVGAHGGDDNMASGSGSAYVFSRSVGVWTEHQKLLAMDPAPGDSFGRSVALDGDTAVVGAGQDDDNGLNTGSAYVFTRSGASWAEQVKLQASDGAAWDRLGFEPLSVSVSGSDVLAGVPDSDSNGSSSGAAYVFSVQTDDQPPIVSNVLASPNPVAHSTAFNITATVDDSTTGGSTIANADYTISGGASTAMSASDGAFDGVTENVTATVAAGLDAGVYDVCVTGTDAPGNTSAPVCAFLAVYDPSAGFVTGGGWIDSPAGAYFADETLTGKANFGFVSKYQKGRTVPTGNTEFQFQAGDLRFKSSSYEWLVVAGARAQFKGVGQINNAGNYGFMLTAIDENETPSTDVDLFRIKIWDKDNGDAIVYDNELGAGESADPTTSIGGGSIIIHVPKGNR